MIFVVLGQGADCTPSPAVVARLPARFRYENGRGVIVLHDVRFSFVRLGDRGYLRQDTVPNAYDPSHRPVLIFAIDSGVTEAEGNCPPGPSWIGCAMYLQTQGEEVVKYPPSSPPESLEYA